MAPDGGRDSVERPAALLDELRAAADQEQRPVADMLRDLVERGSGSGGGGRKSRPSGGAAAMPVCPKGTSR
jgi:hypothetical protein